MNSLDPLCVIEDLKNIARETVRNACHKSLYDARPKGQTFRSKEDALVLELFSLALAHIHTAVVRLAPMLVLEFYNGYEFAVYGNLREEEASLKQTYPRTVVERVAQILRDEPYGFPVTVEEEGPRSRLMTILFGKDETT